MRVAVLSVRSVHTEETWEEPYNEGEGYFNASATDDQIRAWAARLIENYNMTLRPGETKRELVGVEIKHEERPVEHDWRKTNLITIESRGRYYDTVTCINCSVTARRYGLTSVVRDPAYKAAGFATCTGARLLIARREIRRLENRT